jgi:diadenosine tetraphosphate (Ap4A) HIT family hydrolase
MNCFSCETDDTENKIFETQNWIVLLGMDQSNLGRAIVVLKSHKESIVKLTTDEFCDLHRVISKYELALKEAFGTTMFNWTCLMNDAYKSDPPKPHIHWHCWPRYDHPVTIDNVIFTDPDFGHHYNKHRKTQLNKDIREKIISLIQKKLKVV